MEPHLLSWVPEVERLLKINDALLTDELLDPTILIGPASGSLSPQRPNDARHTLGVARRDLDWVHEYRQVRRIDGNHRLALAEKLAEDDTEPARYRAPFCLVFLGPPGDANDDYEESVIFHTINSTALPLESERALQLILGQSNDFAPVPTDEWQSNRALHLTRLLNQQLSQWALQHPRKIGNKMGPRYLSGTHRAARWLCEHEPPLFDDRAGAQKFATRFGDDLSEVVQAELGRFDMWARRISVFLEFASLALLSTRGEGDESQIFDADQARQRLIDFWQWVRPSLFMDDDAWPGQADDNTHHHQHLVAAEMALNTYPPDATGLWRLYEAACARVPRKIFLARWNPGDGHSSADVQRSRHRLEAIKDSIKRVKSEGVYLELCDIDSRRGGTYPIALEVWNQIESSEIMLIDLTGERANVMLEAGYALSLHNKGRLLFMFHSVDNSQPPSNLNGFDIITFRDTAEIADKLCPRLINIVQQSNQLS